MCKICKTVNVRIVDKPLKNGKYLEKRKEVLYKDLLFICNKQAI